MSARGFTVVDVVVGCGVALVAGAVAGPMQTATWEGSYDKRDMMNQKFISDSQALFIGDHQGQFSGPNVTGWGDVPGSTQDPGRYVGDTTSSTPTQTHDWITPIVGEALHLSENRAERVQQLFDRLRDPRATRKIDELFVGSGSEADLPDFIDRLDDGGFWQVSYLSPEAFHTWSQPQVRFGSDGVATLDSLQWRNAYGGIPFTQWTGTMVRVPDGYRPRLDRVGLQLSGKVQFGSGTRYLSGGVLDINQEAVASRFGNFTSGFPGWSSETSYGRAAIGGGDQIPLSYRIPGDDPQDVDQRRMRVTMWDGSTRTLSVGESKAQADMFVPRGSEVVSLEDAEPEFAARWEEGDILP